MTIRSARLAGVLACATLAGSCGAGPVAPSHPPAGSGAVAPGHDAAVKQAVEKCERSVGRQPGVPPGVRFDLLESCQRVTKGEDERAHRAVHKATREACEKLVEENVPRGAGRRQATCALELDR